MMKIRIEDNFEDVLGKAAAGLELSPIQLASRTSLTQAEIEALLEGRFDEAHVRELAPALKLRADALLCMGRFECYPEVSLPAGLEAYNTSHPVPGYEAMTVNSYLIWNRETRKAVAFDTGASADIVLADIRKHALTLEALFLTHTHKDHIAAYDALLEATDFPQSYTPENEPHATAGAVKDGDVFEVAGFRIEARLTHGHSPGGTSYVIGGLSEGVAIVGDSLFCLSQGGAPGAYAQALENNRRKILSLPESTVLCPGHGPLTTVAFEKAHNPFYPEFDADQK